jgi:phospholipid/cholesterol/gamma-HCH transport system permease protein
MIQSVGQIVVGSIDGFGDFCRFSGRTFSWIADVLWRWQNMRLLLRQLYEVGTRSVPVVAVTGAFIGMVMAVQVVAQFKAVNLTAQMGTIVNLSVLRELGPVLTGILLAGRVGGGITAELGTMRVTEQIDALRAMGTDPIRVLVVPRLLACVLIIPVLVTYSNFVGIAGGYGISVYVYSVNAAEFWRNASDTVGYWDIFYGPFKSVFFGTAISLVSCYKGFHCAPGAAGVGRACTDSYVASTMAILTLDFFLGMLLNAVNQYIYGVVPVL